MKRLAVVDWGIGGAGFWKEWRKRHPSSSMVYYSDSGYTPYGKLEVEPLVDRLVSRVDLLENLGVTHVVFACNAASTVIKHVKERKPGVHVEGVIEATRRWIKNNFDQSKPLSIIGGKRTIDSNEYLLRSNVSQIVGQPFSAIVEKGELNDRKTESVIKELLKGVSGDLVLACTHYVALKEQIQKCIPTIKCHDPMPFIVDYIESQWGKLENSSEDVFLTSGDLDEMLSSAQKAFGVF